MSKLSSIVSKLIEKRQAIAVYIFIGIAFLCAGGTVRASISCTQYGSIPSGYYDANCIFHNAGDGGTTPLISSLTPSPTTISLGQSTSVAQSISQAVYGIPYVDVDDTPDCDLYSTTSGSPVLLGDFLLNPSGFSGSTTTYPTATTTYSTNCWWVGYNSTGDMNAYPSVVTVYNTVATSPVNVGSCTSPPNDCSQTVSGMCPQNTPPPDPSYYGQPCTSPANSCGMTNSGTYDCNKTCSATTPPDSECKVANLVPQSLSPTIAIAGQQIRFVAQILNNGGADVTQPFSSDLYTCPYVDGQPDPNCTDAFPITLSFWQRLIASILPVARADSPTDTPLSAISSLAVNQTAPANGTAKFNIPDTYSTQVCADRGQVIPVLYPTQLCMPGPLLIICDSGDKIVGGTCVAPPTCSITASPATIDANQSSNLSWSSNGTTCTSTDFSTGGSCTGGPLSTGPLSTSKSYSLSCTGPGGTTDAPPATVNVNGPTATISANPTRVASGETTALTWSSTHAASCTMTRAGNNWAGNPDANNAASGGPTTDPTPITAQTEYDLNCNGAFASTTVNVAPAFQNF